MNVIFYASYGGHPYPLIPPDSGVVGPELSKEIGRDDRLAIKGRVHTMDVILNPRMWHSYVAPPIACGNLRGSCTWHSGADGQGASQAMESGIEGGAIHQSEYFDRMLSYSADVVPYVL